MKTRKNHKSNQSRGASLKIYTYGIFLLLFLACKDQEVVPQLSGPGEFMTQTGDAEISGELLLPDGKGPFPVLIIVPGSGNTPKEASRDLARVFTQQGFAIYIYDKRGLGKSTGTYPLETIENPMDFLRARRDDVQSIVDLLKRHSDIRGDKIGLFGTSQGAWVNELVFDQTNDIDFILMAVGGVAPTGIENYYDQLTEDPNISIEEAIDLLKTYEGVIGFNPLPIIENMQIPVAWIYGGLDRSHPSHYDIPVLEMLRKNNFSVFLFENSNHDLIDVTTGQFEPTLLPTIFNWLGQHAK